MAKRALIFILHRQLLRSSCVCARHRSRLSSAHSTGVKVHVQDSNCSCCHTRNDDSSRVESTHLCARRLLCGCCSAQQAPTRVAYALVVGANLTRTSSHALCCLVVVVVVVCIVTFCELAATNTSAAAAPNLTVMMTRTRTHASSRQLSLFSVCSQ